MWTFVIVIIAVLALAGFVPSAGTAIIGGAMLAGLIAFLAFYRPKP